MLRKRANTYYIGEDGKAHCFGSVKYKVASDSYVFHDITQPVPNRFQGYSNVEKGLAMISLRKDPSPSDLTNETSVEGWVDLSGNIFSKSGMRVGYITDAKGRPGISGSGKWYELWLKKHSYVFACPPLASEGGVLVGKIVESGRLGAAKLNTYTISARAGGFLLLYKDRQPGPESEDSLTPSASWKDTALPAALIFTVLYVMCQLCGLEIIVNHDVHIATSMLAFLLFWFFLRQTKIEADLEGKRFNDFLMLVNRNTGLGGINNLILTGAFIASLQSYYLSSFEILPIPLAILVGMWINKRYITHAPWKLCDTEEEFSLPEWEDGSEEVVPDTDNVEKKGFRWALDSSYHSLCGEIILPFSNDKIKQLRATNPFKLNPSESFKSNVTELLAKCEDKTNVHRLLRYIIQSAKNAELDEIELMQFILDFVQIPNIKYKKDETCEEIGCPREYARFPDETMYDGHGDCDCKAMLAAVLFKEAGFKTAYLITSNHAAVAVASRTAPSPDMNELGGDSLLVKDGYMYFFCETTGDGFRIGDLGDTRKESIKDIIFLN